MLGLIDNEEEDLSARLSAWVSENTGKRDRPNATVREAANFINDTLLKEFIEQKVEGVHRISEETARRWLKRLGFHYKKGSTGVYCDKHEAPENQDARRAFIAKIDKINAENNEAALHNDAVKQKIEDIDREIMEKEELAKGAHQTMHQLAVEVTTGEGDAAIPHCATNSSLRFGPSASSYTRTSRSFIRTRIFAQGGLNQGKQHRYSQRAKAPPSWSFSS